MSIVTIRFIARASGIPRRAPVLERALARASPWVLETDWRGAAFGAIAADGAAMPGIAAAVLRTSLGAMSGAWVCLATPVHLVAGMRSVTLAEGGVLDLSPVEAGELACDFNRVFADSGARLRVARATMLLCVFDRALSVDTRDPGDMLGADVFGHQATGVDAPRLRRLVSELEMWLFEHAVNRARAARGALPITSLWLWGGGPMLMELPPVLGWTAGVDPLFGAFGAVTEFPSAPAAGVVVCTPEAGSVGWPDVETRWLVPALRALRAGRLERVELCAAERRFTLRRAQALRFWRRARPWWTWFDWEGRDLNGIS